MFTVVVLVTVSLDRVFYVALFILLFEGEASQKNINEKTRRS
jgi:hypothetical protein